MQRFTSVPPTAVDHSAVKIADYDDYAEIQRAVDRLSDRGFPVQTVSIVWTDLRHIEYVTGRLTILTAALQGGLAGAWFGSLLGFLLTLFVETDEGTSAAAIVFTYLLIGALAGALWYGVSHALRRGRRDFQTLGRFDADRYELWAAQETSELAIDVLGLKTSRPQDPDSTEST